MMRSVAHARGVTAWALFAASAVAIGRHANAEPVAFDGSPLQRTGAVDVRALGAGRGADDQPTVQRLLDQGAAVYFPDGTYRFKRALRIRRDGQQIVCADGRVSLRAEFEATLPVHCEPSQHACPPDAKPQDVCASRQRVLCPFAPAELDGLIEVEGVRDFSLSGCHLIGPSSQNGSRGIELRSVHSARLTKVTLDGFTQTSVRVLDASSGVVMEDVHTSRQLRRAGVRDGEAQIFVRSTDGTQRPHDIECIRCQTRGGGADVAQWNRGIYYSEVDDGRIIDADVRDQGGNNICIGGGLQPYSPSRRITIRGGHSIGSRGNGIYFYNAVVDSHIDGLESAFNEGSGINLTGHHFDNAFGSVAPNLLHHNGEAGFLLLNFGSIGHNVTSDIAEDNSVGFFLSRSPGTSLVNVVTRASDDCKPGRRQRFAWAQPSHAQCSANGVYIERGSHSTVIDGGSFSGNVNFGIQIVDEADTTAGPQHLRSSDLVEVVTPPRAFGNGKGSFSPNVADRLARSTVPGRW